MNSAHWAREILAVAKQHHQEIPYPSGGSYAHVTVEDGSHILVWFRGGYDLNAAVGQLTPPLIEIAGPSPYGYQVTPFSKVPAPLLISNILPKDACAPAEALPYPGRYAFQADACSLPIRECSVNAVFCCTLAVSKETPDQSEEAHAMATRITRVLAMEEARRVLRPHGFLVWHGARREDLCVGLELGYTLEYFSAVWSKSRKRMKDILGSVFRKPG